MSGRPGWGARRGDGDPARVEHRDRRRSPSRLWAGRRAWIRGGAGVPEGLALATVDRSNPGRVAGEGQGGWVRTLAPANGSGLGWLRFSLVVVVGPLCEEFREQLGDPLGAVDEDKVVRIRDEFDAGSRQLGSESVCHQ